MTAVPQRTALSHAFGAFCVTLVDRLYVRLRSSRSPLYHGGSFRRSHPRSLDLHRQPDLPRKLQEILPQRPVTDKGQLGEPASAHHRGGQRPVTASDPGARQLFPMMVEQYD